MFIAPFPYLSEVESTTRKLMRLQTELIEREGEIAVLRYELNSANLDRSMLEEANEQLLFDLVDAQARAISFAEAALQATQNG